MQSTRRSILWLAIGAMLLSITNRITPASDTAGTQFAAPSRKRKATASVTPPPKKPVAKAPAPDPSPMPFSSRWFTGAPTVGVISRAIWADARPIMDRMTPMDGVNRITLHHEGWNPVYFIDAPTTAERLELIRRSHINRLKSGDIGYHFIIDRAGRVWQGRQAMYQGAHVRSHNEHNIGVMCLGNFDVQSPSSEQLKTLLVLVKALQRFYKVPASRVKMHRELNPTDCPGTNLKAFIIKARKNKTIA
jgi:hypothetical protein